MILEKTFEAKGIEPDVEMVSQGKFLFLSHFLDLSLLELVQPTLHTLLKLRVVLSLGNQDLEESIQNLVSVRNSTD